MRGYLLHIYQKMSVIGVFIICLLLVSCIDLANNGNLITPENSPSPTFEKTLSNVIEITPLPDVSTPTINYPNLLVATIQIKNKGKDDEVHEIWMIDTQNQEKNLIFATTPGTRLSLIDWGSEQSNLLYVLEIKGIGEGNLTWQLYQVNYLTGVEKTFFDEPQDGLARLADFSSEGKWLRLVIEDMISLNEETWLINTIDDSVIKLEKNYASFVWSPNEPDIFAHWQSPITEHNEAAPFGIVIRNINTLEDEEMINLGSLDWGSNPFLIWSLNESNHLKIFFHDEVYEVDLRQGNWNLISDQLKMLPGDIFDQRFLLSPTENWLLSQPLQNIEVVQTNALDEQPFRFEDISEQKREFLSWCSGNINECIITATENGEIQVFQLGEDFRLLNNVNLNDYGLDSQGLYFSIAKPKINHQ